MTSVTLRYLCVYVYFNYIVYNEQDFMYVFECTQEQKRQKLLIWIDKKMSMFHHNLFIHMRVCALIIEKHLLQSYYTLSIF